MATHKKTLIPFQRKLRGKTDYKKRLLLLKSRTIRLVVRPSLNNTHVQFVDFRPEGDVILGSASTIELRKFGWKGATGNLPAAYLAGLLAGHRAKSKSVAKAVLDIGFRKSVPGSRLYAAVKGVLDAGIEVPCSKEVLPKENRLSGDHIVTYAKSSKPGSGMSTFQYSSIQKSGMDVSNMAAHIAELKKKIQSGVQPRAEQVASAKNDLSNIA